MTTTRLKSIAAWVLQVLLAALYTVQALQKRLRFQGQGGLLFADYIEANLKTTRA